MIALIEHDKKKHQINIPMSVNEMTFGDFVDFRSAEKKYLEANEQPEKDVESILELLVETVSALVKGDLYFLPVTFIDDKIQVLFRAKYVIKQNDNISFMRLYVHLCSIINSYTAPSLGPSYEIEWDGEKYYLTPERAERLMEQRSFTVGEVIELKEFQRNFERLREQRPDIDANISFSLGLTEMAVLMRRDGESLPMEKKSRTKFINQRVELFGKLPLDIVFNVRFFLRRILMASVTNHISNSFLKAKEQILEAPRMNNGHKEKRNKGPLMMQK